MTKWVEDKNGNKCSIDYFGTEEATQAAHKPVEEDPYLLEVLNFIDKVASLNVVTGGGEIVDAATAFLDCQQNAKDLYKKLDAVKWGLKPVYRELLDPDMPAQAMRLHMGEITANEMRVARAAIAWANTKAMHQWLTKEQFDALELHQHADNQQCEQWFYNNMPHHLWREYMAYKKRTTSTGGE